MKASRLHDVFSKHMSAIKEEQLVKGTLTNITITLTLLIMRLARPLRLKQSFRGLGGRVECSRGSCGGRFTSWCLGFCFCGFVVRVVVPAELLFCLFCCAYLTLAVEVHIADVYTFE